MNRKQTPAVVAAFCALLFGACASALKCSDTKDGITVELNNAVAKQTKENPFVTELLEADFTCDVMIRKHSFSFSIM